MDNQIVEEIEIEAVVEEIETEETEERETDTEMGTRILEVIMEMNEEEGILMVEGRPEIVTRKEIIMIVKNLEIIPDETIVGKMDTTGSLDPHEVEVVIMTDTESDHEIKTKRKKQRNHVVEAETKKTKSVTKVVKKERS